MRKFLFFTFFAFNSLALGQASRKVDCRFIGFGGKAESFVYTTAASGNVEKCKLSILQISPTVTCSSVNGQITFFSTPDKKTRSAVANIPETVNKCVLVFVPSKAATPDPAALAWRVLVIEDSPKNFQDGGALIVNFYSKDIQFSIGEHKGLMKPAGMKSLTMPTLRNPFNMSAVAFKFNEGNKWVLASENSLRFVPNIRYLMFTYSDEISGRATLRVVSDIK